MATYYIDIVNGDDSTGDGSEANPWQNISKFNAECSAGDTCIMEAGTYTHNLSVSFFSTVSVTYEGRLGSNGQIQVFIDGGGASSTTFTTQLRPYNNTYKNIHWQNFVQANTDGGLFRCDAAAPPTFENCMFSKFAVGTTLGAGYRGGMFSGSGNSSTPIGVTLRRCSIWDVGLASGTADGCLFSTRVMNTSSITMTNCTFVYSGIVTYGSAALVNCQIDPPNGTGPIVMKNNIFQSEYASATNLIQVSGEDYTGLDFQYNALDNVNAPVAGSGTIANNITTTVNFVSAANGNFNLRPDVSGDLIAAGVQV